MFFYYYQFEMQYVRIVKVAGIHSDCIIFVRDGEGNAGQIGKKLQPFLSKVADKVKTIEEIEGWKVFW